MAGDFESGACLIDLFNPFYQQRASAGGLSPRSQRLSLSIPKPHSQAIAAIIKLESVRKQVKLTLEESRKVKEIVSSSLHRYFALLPEDKVLPALLFETLKCSKTVYYKDDAKNDTLNARPAIAAHRSDPRFVQVLRRRPQRNP